ncbi:MAG: hypothetical protein AAF721_20605 [Myxococcota bacterium]
MVRGALTVRRYVVVSMLGGLGVAAGSCSSLRPFDCLDDEQCDTIDQGVCIEPGFCAFPDPECETGYRFHASAGESLSGQCVSATTADTDRGSTSDVAPPDDSGDTSTGAADTVSVVGSSDGTGSSATSAEESGTTGGPCGDMPCPCTDAVVAGQTHTCALRSDASVVCWGQNDYGKLGTGSDSPAFVDEPTVIAPGVDFTALAASRNQSCAVAADGGTWCWGRNNLNQSVPGAGGPFVATMDTSATKTAVALATGFQHSCADVGDGMLTCWGSNSYGQLATMGGAPGPLTSGPHPDEGETILGMAGGQHHACLATESAVKCWGRNNYGQNGSGMMGGNRFNPIDVGLDAGVGIIAVAAGRFHSCAATDGGNAVYCWGRNGCGQVSEGGTSCGGPEIAYEPELVELPGTVVQLSGRYDHTCALVEDGSAYCWGDKKGYWLGTEVGNGTTLSPPAKVVVLDEIAEPIVDLAVGWEHACGRAASGRLWCWGSDQYEQLGENDPPDGQRTIEMDLLCP